MNTLITNRIVAFGFVLSAFLFTLAAPAAQVVLDAKILRIPADSGFNLDDRTTKPERPNPSVTGIQPPMQVANSIKNLIENQNSKIVYSNRFVTSDARRVDATTEHEGAETTKESLSLGLWITPRIEGESVRISAGLYGLSDAKPSPLSFESFSLQIPNNSSAVFVTRDIGQVDPDHFLVILTPKILKL